MSTSKMCKYVFSAAIVALVLFVSNVCLAEAQAVFQVSASASVMTNIGQTELLGSVTLTVVGGTTQAGTIEFFVPNVTFTNDVGNGIAITGTGGLAAATIAAVVTDGGVVIINVPAGAVTGASMTLSGVRMAAVGLKSMTLDASISSSGNSIVAGQSIVRIVQSITDGLIVDTPSTNTVTIVNNVVVTAPSAFTFHEGSPGTLSGAIGVAGRDTKTQIIFQVTGLPDNVSLTFPATVTSNTGATLVTPGGAAVVLTNQSNTNQVVYEFNDSAISPFTIDSFSVVPALDFPGTPGTGTAVIQVALGPIGAAVPTTASPSTAIPRFAQLFLPPMSSPSGPPVTTLAIPVPGGIDDANVTVSNVSGAAVLNFLALAENGTVLTSANSSNQVTQNAFQTATFSLKDLFGSSASAAGISTVNLQSQNTSLVVNSFGNAGGRRFANNSTVDAGLTYLPFDRLTSSDIPVLSINDTGTANVSATITLRTTAGATISTVSRNINAGGALRESFSSLFSSVSIPLSGYLVVSSSSPVRSALINNPMTRPDEITTLLLVSSWPTTAPFFAFGGGYASVLELVNGSETQTVQITLNAYNSTGAAISSQPMVVTMGPSERRDLDFGGIFASGPGNQTAAGYFTVAAQPAIATLFAPTPVIYGVLRVGVGKLTSVIPFSPDAGNLLYLTPAAETATTYTGLALVNPASAAASVTIDAFAGSGASLGSTTFNLMGNTGRIQLLRELIPQTLNNDNLLVRVTSTGSVLKLIGFRGRLDLSELIYLKAQTTP